VSARRIKRLLLLDPLRRPFFLVFYSFHPSFSSLPEGLSLPPFRLLRRRLSPVVLGVDGVVHPTRVRLDPTILQTFSCSRSTLPQPVDPIVGLVDGDADAESAPLDPAASCSCGGALIDTTPFFLHHLTGPLTNVSPA
jgi:hypothetical protein